MSRRLRQRATVVLVRNGRVLLVSDETGMFLMPGGGIEPGEQPMAAAVRELHEETGLTATRAEVGDETRKFLLPGGGIEPGEQPMAAAVRELHEHAGDVTTRHA